MSKSLYFILWGYFQRLEEMPCIFYESVKNNAGYCGEDNQGPSVEVDDATLGVSEKLS